MLEEGETAKNMWRVERTHNHLEQWTCNAHRFVLFLHPLPLSLSSSYPAAIQILAALRHKEKTGKGAVIGTFRLPSKRHTR